MPELVTVPDPVAGATATGRIRCDRRQSTSASPHPPLVLIGGMTQTLHSWGGQIRPLSARSEVLAYEARGQGATELDEADCSPATHVTDFVNLVTALSLPTPLDLCGFSFGGRTALAIAATHPELVRRLVVSGVAHERGVVGRLIVEGWIAALRTGDLEALARISLPDILGPAYLDKNEALIEGMVKTTVQRNRYAGIKALFEQTLALAPGSPWHPSRLAERVRCPTLLMGGALDRIAAPAEVRRLAEVMGARVEILPDAGHTIAIEAPEAWRAVATAFLDA